jgi:hypothetical protein
MEPTMQDPGLVFGKNRSVEEEGRHHSYRGNRIPWYVHLIWISFWIFAVAYTLRWLFPAIRQAFPARQ